ncbi:signal peptidase I [Lignipirellula cremea]|uniref:Signal peptidase I n=2 Tax=Lignipirellula cremea TaxID=2528010 RepID=A0A518DME3_9BACT|nr:signal peptidase I [Lignipirellula cremea]
MASRSVRETIESIVIAIILAFLFRAFEAEAFVIPTGSMAPTLQGRHVDIPCQKCGFWYRAGASMENSDTRPGEQGVVVAATCPICRFTMTLDRNNAGKMRPADPNAGNPNQESFTGDRILVSKFAYDLADPERFDVIVFKYPHNATQNYIKRLVGLPEEVIRIQHGDVYTLPFKDLTSEEKELLEDSKSNIGTKMRVVNEIDLSRFRMIRKPADKVQAMLQLVHDTDFIPGELIASGLPSRWQEWSPGNAGQGVWETSEDRKTYKSKASDQESWVRYRHILPRINWGDGPSDWSRILRPELGPIPQVEKRAGQLITDFYAYNADLSVSRGAMSQYSPKTSHLDDEMLQNKQGLHWVGDLAVECLANITSDQGELLLDLVEGGVHHQCRIDLATGKAQLTIDGSGDAFETQASELPSASTAVRGQGTHRIRFANVDDQLLLWVDHKLVAFDRSTAFNSDPNARPQMTEADPLDLAPLGVGVKNASVELTDLRVYRDVYYVATRRTSPFQQADYPEYYANEHFRSHPTNRELFEIFSTPSTWATTDVFDPQGRDKITYWLEKDQFFPMGDNSPQSADARMWHPTEWYVKRDLLTGKALLIYWPHHWRRPIPLQPNFSRMGLIR